RQGPESHAEGEALRGGVDEQLDPQQGARQASQGDEEQRELRTELQLRARGRHRQCRPAPGGRSGGVAGNVIECCIGTGGAEVTELCPTGARWACRTASGGGRYGRQTLPADGGEEGERVVERVHGDDLDVAGRGAAG